MSYIGITSVVLSYYIKQQVFACWHLRQSGKHDLVLFLDHTKQYPWSILAKRCLIIGMDIIMSCKEQRRKFSDHVIRH